MARVALVNTDPEYMQLLVDILHEHGGFESTVIDADRSDPVEAVRDFEPDGLVIDLQLGDDRLGGWKIVEAVRSDARYADLPVLICSADVELLADVTAGVNVTPQIFALAKPFALTDLLAAVERLLAASPR